MAEPLEEIINVDVCGESRTSTSSAKPQRCS